MKDQSSPFSTRYARWYEFGFRSPSILFARLRNKHRPIFRLKMAWQRARRGYSDEDCWNLHYTLARMTVVGVQKLREWAHGYPGELSGWEEWDAILARIEEGFQAWLDTDGWPHPKSDAEAQFNDAMALYAKWFGALWD